MNSIPLAVALIPFALFLILFFVFTIFNFFHLIHYGFHTSGRYAILLIYITGTIFILGGSYIVLQKYDWKAPIDTTILNTAKNNLDFFQIPDVPTKETETESEI